ncbi:hypothetical protein [Planotetraspora sp. GP83]|uniref:hypothetical protein n=1 Tax=Planotetraspora sp. GP83 TaxID=3156264 RepID=UPI003517C416
MKNNPYDNRYGTAEQPTPETPEPLEEEARREEALAGGRHDAHEGPGPVYSAEGADLDGSRYTGESGYADGSGDTRNAESPGTWVAGSGVTAHTADSRTADIAETSKDTADTAGTADGRTFDRHSGDGAYASQAPGDRTFDAEAVDSVPAPRTGATPAARESLERVDARDDVLAPDPDGRTAAHPEDVEFPGADSTADSTVDATRPSAESTLGTTRPDAESTTGTPGTDAESTATPDLDAETTSSETLVAAEGASGIAEPGEESASGIDFDRRWHEIKAGFVDDPRSSVEQADALVEKAVALFTTRRQALLDRWKNNDQNDGDQNDTEALRLALRDYYALLLQLTGK